ncbi:MAG: hypothetical protein ACFCU6_14005 [Balneolaceae bacterium]
MHTQLVTDNKYLNDCVSRLNHSPEISVDLEFDKNYYRYGFNLCLIQAYAGDICYLIDPLSPELDIDLFFPVLQNEHIQKVVFAFGEDLRLLHSLGCFPKNIYDLNFTTSLLNYPPSSLTNYISDVLGIDTGKSSQQSNWFKRPLSDEQMQYAAQDVLHLSDLKKILEKEARKKNIDGWIAEENALFDKLNYAEIEDNSLFKENDKRNFSEFEWHLFKNLLLLREELAKKFNKPGFRIISKDILSDLAKNTGNPEPQIFAQKLQNSDIPAEELKTPFLNLCLEAQREAMAMGLSKSEPAAKPLSKKEFLDQKKLRVKMNIIKNNFLKPVKNQIAKDYGSEAASFILSNRIMNEIINGERDMVLNYKSDLILTYARKLGIDPEEYFPDSFLFAQTRE